MEPRWGRRGHGSRLLAAVADVARGGGAARLQVWLPEADARLRGLLRVGRLGTRRVGAHAGHRRREPLREIRWHALLGDEDPA